MNEETTTSTLDIERQLSAPLNAVKLLSQTDTTATVGGYGVVFGGRDLVAETFTKNTDYQLDLVPTKPVFYDHTQREEIGHKLGQVHEVKSDDTGLWVQAELDRSAEYVDEVLKLVEAGALGWSSGSIAHLARVGERGIIKSWPIVEFSLTPTPAEPRTLGVELIKQLAEVDETLKAFIPEDGQETISDDATGGEAEPIENDLLEKITWKKTKLRLMFRL